MVVATLAAWPLLFKSLNAVIAFIPFSALFNAVAAVIGIAGGFLVYEALSKRTPALLPNANKHNTQQHE
jgi:hypothetical protein